MTPTEALEEMLSTLFDRGMYGGMEPDDILAALPHDAHLFTVDSLASAIFATDDPNFRFATRGNCERFATAILQAAKEKEAERENE